MNTNHRPTRVLIKRASLSPHDPHTQPIYWALLLNAATVPSIRNLADAWHRANTAYPISSVTSEAWLGIPFTRTPAIDAMLSSALRALVTYPTVVVELTEALDVALEDAEAPDLDPVYIECTGSSITLWAIVDDADTRATASEILLIDQLELLMAGLGEIMQSAMRTIHHRTRSAIRWVVLAPGLLMDHPLEAPKQQADQDAIKQQSAEQGPPGGGLGRQQLIA